MTALHPLRSVTADEIVQVREILTAAGLVAESTRFVYVGLDEPEKAAVLSGSVTDRRVRALLLDTATGESTDLIVSVTTGTIVSQRTLDTANGQAAILDEEFAAIEGILLADQGWCDALAKRGVDPKSVALAPLSAGHYGFEDEVGKRIIRVLAFQQKFEKDLCWAHPVDGLCAYVDIIAGTVHKLVDAEVMPVPQESANFDDPEYVGPLLEGLKPINIVQPEGASFTVDDEVVTWGNWRLRVGFDVREGLVLHEISFDDDGEQRPIIYRASISEMVVPYGDPSPVRFWQNYFDTGEYLYGRYTNSLQLGCDCVGEIYYFDGVHADELGNPATITNAICMHEEDFGTLWKHTDLYTGMSEVRRSRRLVISFFTTVGNYDYGFFWYFYLDGRIECEAKLTGMLFTSGYPEGGNEYATKIGPDLGAPYHQHLFSARLDMMVDGLSNAVDEIEGVRIPMSESNPYGNAFTKKTTRIATEAEAARLADASVGRSWLVVNTEKNNRTGAPVGYMLYPEAGPTLMADPDSSIAHRATFTTKDLWVTNYSVDEKYPAGDFINQNPGSDGLPKFQAANRSIDGEDIVLWHTFGPTHFPRVEDWPIMPVDYAKFTLKPWGFFDRNPSVNVPADMNECSTTARLSEVSSAPGTDSCHSAGSTNSGDSGSCASHSG